MKTLTTMLALLLFPGWMASAAAAPITTADVIVVDGTYWAQVDLFTGLSWNDISAVCPSGVCGTGKLNGHDMQGWTWADQDRVNALFNSYLSAAGVTGDDLLHGDDLYVEISSAWAPAFFIEWRKTAGSAGNFVMVDGTTSSENGTLSVRARLIDFLPGQTDWADSYTPLDKSRSLPVVGGFFFSSSQPPPPDVSAPATLGLMGLALVGLGWKRRLRAVEPIR